ncbi:MAG: peptidylprolyl isomerase [Caulobacteraceae bacterium]|nr:peptidylprolyl isomerase [Caulobacteraceae bacterium]
MKRLVLSLAALLAAATPALAAEKPLPAAAWRNADAENTLVIDTNQGRIIVELVPEAAPDSVARVKQLARTHFYDGLTFFRVIDDFMDQTGDPRNNGQGGSVLPNVKGEFTFKLAPNSSLTVVDHPQGQDAGFIGALPVLAQPAAMAALMVDGRVTAYPTFCQGVIGMARAEDPDTANSQFFLMRQPRSSLDQHYAAFGRVIVGEDVVRLIKTGEPVPDPQDRMTRVQVLADIPEGVRPTVKVVDAKSAYFKALVARTRAEEGEGFSLCDIDVAGQAK